MAQDPSLDQVNSPAAYFTPQDALEQIQASNISFGILTKQEIHQVMASTAAAPSPSSRPPASAPHATKTLSNGVSLLGVQDGRGFCTGNFRAVRSNIPFTLPRLPKEHQADQAIADSVFTQNGQPDLQLSPPRKTSAQRASPLSQAATAVAGSNPVHPEPSTSKQPLQPWSQIARGTMPDAATLRSSSPLPSRSRDLQPDSTPARKGSPSTKKALSPQSAATRSPANSPASSKASAWGKPPPTALALQSANDSLSASPRKKGAAQISSPVYKGPVDHNAPSSPALAPGFSFSKRLKVPSSVSQNYPSAVSPSSLQSAVTGHDAEHTSALQPSSAETPSTATAGSGIETAASLNSSPVQPQPPKSALKSPPTSPPKPALKATSWAALLRDPADVAAEKANGSTTQHQQVKRVSIALPPESSTSASTRSGMNGHGDHKFSAMSTSIPNKKSVSLGQALKGVEHDQVHPHIAPRGMVNTGNLCFENTILQALVFCPPFYNLIRLLGQSLPHDLSGANRLLEATIWLVNEYKVIQRPDMVIPREWSDPFLPEQVYEALRHNKRFETLQQGQQEDAQEFLGFFLDTLHEELLAAIEKSDRAIQNKVEQTTHTLAGGHDDDDWEEVGQKGRTATTRKADMKESPITKIFAGLLRSMLRAPGQKDSALSEPFLSLQLDIQPSNVESIEDALANLAAPETVQDYATAAGRRVDATKQLCLEHLPPVLILHLKRFSYNNVGGTVKNHKVVGFDTDLKISPSILAPSQRSAGPVEYKLNAVIYHHGRSATGGHYTVALRQQNDKWINVDDTTIMQVSPAEVAVNRVEEVLRLSLPSSYDGIPERSPYLLFYTRADTSRKE